MALLLQFFDELPEPREGETRPSWKRRMEKALNIFKRKVLARYTEGTLQRLLDATVVRTRRAAVLGLSLTGTMASNAHLAFLLQDEDVRVRQLATDALWSIWFRAGSAEHNKELQRLMRLNDPAEAGPAFEAFLKRAPEFAEAYNQRAIMHFRLGEFQKSIADCEKALKLNPFHFGAQAGMAQCYMKLRKPKAALRSFRKAYALNPNMKGVEDSIRALEEMLGEEGKKDDKK